MTLTIARDLSRATASACMLHCAGYVRNAATGAVSAARGPATRLAKQVPFPSSIGPAGRICGRSSRHIVENENAERRDDPP